MRAINVLDKSSLAIYGVVAENLPPNEIMEQPESAAPGAIHHHSSCKSRKRRRQQWSFMTGLKWPRKNICLFRSSPSCVAIDFDVVIRWLMTMWHSCCALLTCCWLQQTLHEVVRKFAMLYVGSANHFELESRNFAMMLLNSPTGIVWPFFFLTAETIHAHKSWRMNENKCMVIMNRVDGVSAAKAPHYGIFSREAFRVSRRIKFTDVKVRKLYRKLFLPNDCIRCLDHLLDTITVIYIANS